MLKQSLFIALLALPILAGCNQINPNPTYSLSDSGFTATGKYQGNNSWTYDVKGNVPSPCNTLDVVPVVSANSEEATLHVSIGKPTEGVVCAQVIEPRDTNGTFTANQTAIIKLSVDTSK